MAWPDIQQPRSLEKRTGEAGAPVLGLFRVGLPRSRRPHDRHDGANLLSRHVAEDRRQCQRLSAYRRTTTD
jgi:hypothetical protein